MTLRDVANMADGLRLPSDPSEDHRDGDCAGPPLCGYCRTQRRYEDAMSEFRHIFTPIQALELLNVLGEAEELLDLPAHQGPDDDDECEHCAEDWPCPHERLRARLLLLNR